VSTKISAVQVFATVVFGLAAAFADEPGGKAVQPGLEQFDGAWVPVSVLDSGVAREESELKGLRTVVKAGKVIHYNKGEEYARGSFTIGAGKTPAEIDFTHESGSEKGQTHKGIYKVEGTTATFCYAEAGKDRPTEFASTKGSGTRLLVLKREKL
jgi:uncharacterized protein (TIGR03067 family)